MSLRPRRSENLVFVSYSHADAKWLAGMRSHLKLLERHAGIEQWDDTKIKPGTQWKKEIQGALERARAAVLLVSADFLTSEFIVTNELPPLLKAAEERGTLILVLIVRPCRFERTELARFQAVNPPSKPLSDLSPSQREGWYVKLSGLIEEALDADETDGAPPAKVVTPQPVTPPHAALHGEPGSEELARRHKLRLRFWEQLLDLARANGLAFHANRAPAKSNWIGGPAGIAGYRWNYVIWMHDEGAVELDIDVRDKRANKRLFDKLRTKQAEIEAAFGDSLEWDRMDDARRSGIRYTVREGGLMSPEAEWPRIQAAMVNAMTRLTKAIQPHLQGRSGSSSRRAAREADGRVREARFQQYTVRELQSGSIEVKRDGKTVTPTKPLLREIAEKLGIELHNGRGNPMNTRQLGSLLITRIGELEK